MRFTGHLTGRGAVLGLIERNGGPAGLDLSARDLSGVDLSSDILRVELARVKTRLDASPTWFSATRGGVNLRGAILKGTDLRGSLLWRGDYRGTDFQGARLDGADLGSSTLAGADCRAAFFHGAQLTNLDFSDADLTGANLCHANLENTNLSVAKSLAGIHLFGANLSCTEVHRGQLLNGIGEELDQDYLRAKYVYLALKNNFAALGRYEDASWTYIKERRMERMANNPFRARTFFGDDELGVTAGPWRTLRFFWRHTTKWLADHLVGLVCEFGERPSRVVLCSLMLVLIFPAMYFLLGGLSPIGSGTSSGSSLIWANYLEYSAFTFATMNAPDVTPVSHVAKLLTTVEGFLGIGMLALLMFTLGNRIRRN